jgi:hypothetical protein
MRWGFLFIRRIKAILEIKGIFSRSGGAAAAGWICRLGKLF